MKKSVAFCSALLGLIALAAFRGAEGAEDGVLELTPGELEVRKHLPADEYELTTIRLWPGEAPDEPRPIPDESVRQGPRGAQIENVTRPSATVARPKGAPGPVPAVLVCPGGGYGSLGVDDGGVDVVRWLRPLGIAGVYLKYRVPKRHQGYAMHHQPLQDIQRAVRLLRSRATELRIDPERIGVVGFSAGGNLAAMLATNHAQDDPLYEPVDEADELSCRPGFVAMVAPAYLTDPIVSDKLVPALKPERIARNVTPPTFIASAVTDKFAVGACHYTLLLRQKRVPVELHLYERGGHAEGIHDGPDNQWPRMFEDWLRRRGVVGTAGADK